MAIFETLLKIVSVVVGWISGRQQADHDADQRHIGAADVITKQAGAAFDAEQAMAEAQAKRPLDKAEFDKQIAKGDF